MKLKPTCARIVITLTITSLVGCSIVPKKEFNYCADDKAPVGASEALLEIEDPCLDECFDPAPEIWSEISPDDAIDLDNVEYWSLGLQECIQLALQNSSVLRDLGATVVTNPQQTGSIQQPAMVYTNPQFGEEAALAAFDASLSANVLWENNHRVFNNRFIGNQGLLDQDLGDYQWGIAKRAATGSLFRLSHTTRYDFNNSAANRYGSPSGSWDTYVDGEVRQPLLQGAGVEFNRIAGPSDTPGVLNGVLLARTNTDISLAQFEQDLRDFVSDVENAYWDLYFAYVDLEAKIEARDEALRLWENVLSRDQRSSQQTQAQEQYYRFESEVVNAIYGRQVNGTQVNNGSSAGTFQGQGGIRFNERRLRLMLGLSINDGNLIRPADVPLEGSVRFDWPQAVADAMQTRPELREQRWRVKQQELELVANKNFLMPRLDAVARYRFRGFGNDLIGGDATFNEDPASANAFGDMLGGDRQEWGLGLEFNMPIGYRRAHAAVRNSELSLSRQKSLLAEQERTILYGLSSSMGELRRAYEMKTVLAKNLLAAFEQEAAVRVAEKNDLVNLDVLLEAQRILLDSKIRYTQAQVEYMLALKQVHYEKGTLLEYDNVYLGERGWVNAASADARIRDALKGAVKSGHYMDYVISSGPESRYYGPTEVYHEHVIPESPMDGTEPVPVEATDAGFWDPNSLSPIIPQLKVDSAGLGEGVFPVTPERGLIQPTSALLPDTVPIARPSSPPGNQLSNGGLESSPSRPAIEPVAPQTSPSGESPVSMTKLPAIGQ